MKTIEKGKKKWGGIVFIALDSWTGTSSGKLQCWYRGGKHMAKMYWDCLLNNSLHVYQCSCSRNCILACFNCIWNAYSIATTLAVVDTCRYTWGKAQISIQIICQYLFKETTSFTRLWLELTMLSEFEFTMLNAH